MAIPPSTKLLGILAKNVMIRLLPYSPELNPIEQYWKNIKQYLGTKQFFTKEESLSELKKALRKNTFMPQISDY